jgi:hypothetical protein
MNIVEHLQALDKLIIEQTKPPVTAMLRNKLWFPLQQAEAHADAVAKQDETLARHIQTFERLTEENKKLKDENKNLIEKMAARDSEDKQGCFGTTSGIPKRDGLDI